MPRVSRVAPVRRRRKSGKRLLTAAVLFGAVAWLFFYSIKNHAANEQATAPVQLPGADAAAVVPVVKTGTGVVSAPFLLQEELKDAEQQIAKDSDKPGLFEGVFVVEPTSGRYIDVNAHRFFSAASMIKLPVLVKLLIALDQHKLSFDQKLTVRADLVGSGSGCLQWRPKGSTLSLKETAELMMVISDNTATNMIIDALGGIDKCNSDFAKWGMSNTVIHNWLPDLTGTNTTSPYDLALLLGKVDRGELISAEMRSWMYAVLERTHTRSLLPMGMPPGTKIAHKTGDIGGLVGDAGIVTANNGHRYIVVAQVARRWNDHRANVLVRQIGKDVYLALSGDTEGAAQVNIEPPAPAASARHRAHRSVRHRSRKHR